MGQSADCTGSCSPELRTLVAVVLGTIVVASGVPSAALWGVMAGLLRFVPYLGPLLAAVAPLTLGGSRRSRLVDSNLCGAVVCDRRTVAAVFWTWIWGPIGLILSTPLTLCLIVMGRHVTSLEFLRLTELAFAAHRTRFALTEAISEPSHLALQRVNAFADVAVARDI